MMEVERLKSIKEYEERERERHIQQLHGAEVNIYQLYNTVYCIYQYCILYIVYTSTVYCIYNIQVLYIVLLYIVYCILDNT